MWLALHAGSTRRVVCQAASPPEREPEEYKSRWPLSMLDWFFPPESYPSPENDYKGTVLSFKGGWRLGLLLLVALVLLGMNLWDVAHTLPVCTCQ